jgi:hypothetical protein
MTFTCSFCGHEWHGHGPTHRQDDPACPECREEDSWQEELQRAVAGLVERLMAIEILDGDGPMTRTSLELHATAALWPRWPRELCRGVIDAYVVTEASEDCNMAEDGRIYEHGWHAVERAMGDQA